MRNTFRDSRARFIVALVGWSAVLLALVRSSFGQSALVAPFAAWHQTFALGLAAGSAVVVDVSCSGSDVIALSMAAILAYPAPWKERLVGLAVAVVWLASLNLVRIITLVNTAGSPLLTPLHLYVWPAIMIGGSAGFVLGWVRLRQQSAAKIDTEAARWRRFAIGTGLFVVAYAALTPWLLASTTLQRAAMSLAKTAAALLNTFAVNALTGGATLVVAGQSFLVTPECIATPLIPIYLAWALAWPRRVRSRVTAVALSVPLFLSLGVLRLLTVALPAIIGPPLFLTHGFYQFVTALILVAAAAHIRARYTSGPRLAPLAAAVLAGIVVALAFAKPYNVLIESASSAVQRLASHTLSTIPSVMEVQGALSIMPAFELALLCGLAIAAFGRGAGRVLVVLVPIGAVLQVITLVVAGEAAEHIRLEIPATVVRTVSLVTPLGLVLATAAYDRRRQPVRATLVESQV